MAADCTELVLEILQTTPSVTDLVMGGAGGIYAKGEAYMEMLAEAEETRRQAGTPGKLLAIIVQDAGEEQETDLFRRQRVVVWLYDRQRGFENIRAAWKQIYLALQGISSSLSNPMLGYTAVVKLAFASREGHWHDLRMAIDYEGITFEGLVQIDLR